MSAERGTRRAASVAAGAAVWSTAVLLAGCGSSAPSGSTSSDVDPLRYAHASALRIAADIPGCDAIASRPQGDVERDLFRSIAACTVDGSEVRIFVSDPQSGGGVNRAVQSDMFSVGGYGWSVTVHGDRDVAQRVADALHAEFGP